MACVLYIERSCSSCCVLLLHLFCCVQRADRQCSKKSFLLVNFYKFVASLILYNHLLKML